MKSCFDINKEIGSIEIVTTNFVDIGKAFRYQQKYMHLPYSPQLMPLDGLDLNHFITLLGKANRELSRYDGIVQTLPNPDLLLSPFMTQEAVLSSRIEGTQATLDEVYEQGAGITFGEQKREDINEIVNYRKALGYASQCLIERPLTLVLIREIHEILLTGVRGKTKTPGHFRKVQNWIGTKNSPMEKATYVPPDPAYVDMFMENWLDYVSVREHIDPLVQTAIMHAQFELIHPFLDGNGRIGRLMIPLFLYKRKVLHRPIFYMSAYLERHRESYCQCLDHIHKKKEWNEWIAFFLQGIAEQAVENTRRARGILQLYDFLKEDIRQATHSEYSHLLLEGIFEMPTYTNPQMVRLIQMKDPSCREVTIRSLLKRLAENNIVERIRKGAGRTPDIFRMNDLLKIVSGHPVDRFNY